MGDDAVIIEGIESEEARASLYSTIHGAGRLFGRKEAKPRFGRAEMDAWLKSRGVTLIGADLDESPMAGACRRSWLRMRVQSGWCTPCARLPSSWPERTSSIRSRIE
jgi:RNA-splicing ligase RtcB